MTSNIKNFVLKKLGLRTSSANNKEKDDNSLSASIKSNGSAGSNGSNNRIRRKSSSDHVGNVECSSNHGRNGEISTNNALVDGFSTTLQLSTEKTLPMHQFDQQSIPIPPRRMSPKCQSEKSIMSSSEKSMISDVLSDDSSIFSLGTDLTMHDKRCSDTNGKVTKSKQKDSSYTVSMRSSASYSSLTSVLSVSTTTVATSEAIPTRQIDLTNLPPHPEITHALEVDEKDFVNDSSPEDGEIVSVLFAGKTKRGIAPNNPTKPNQDAFFMKHDPNTSSLIIACFDGHGQYGHDVSRYCKKYLEKCLCDHPSFSYDVKRAVLETIVYLDKSMLASPSLNTMFSGTTMTLIILRGTLVYVANIGDSRIVLGHSGRPKSFIDSTSSGSTTEEESSNNTSRQQSPSNHPSCQKNPLVVERKDPPIAISSSPFLNPPQSTLTAAWNAFNMSKMDQLLPSIPKSSISNNNTKSNIITLQLSIDHKPDNFGEKQRIESNGGRVLPVQGTNRVYLSGDDIPGLAMSRSLGDFIAHSVGVSSVPDFFEYDLSSIGSATATAQLRGKCGQHVLVRSVLLIGTDGIYDMISNEVAIAMAFKYWGDPAAATEAIVDHTRERWLKRWKLADDSTICIVNLEHTTSGDI